MQTSTPHFKRGLVWFRRDLRTEDHTALHHALRRCESVFCAFVFDQDILNPLLAQGHAASRRVDFIHGSVTALRQTLEQAGGTLVVRHARAVDAIPELSRALGIDAVFVNRDYEPAAIARDDAVEQRLSAQSCAMFHFKDHVIFDGDEVLTGQSTPFSVFTPYKNAWLRRLSPDDLRPRTTALRRDMLPSPAHAGSIPSLSGMGFSASNLEELGIIPGSEGAHALLDDFVPRLDSYHVARDFPAVRGPSYLSVHLRFGTISIRTLAACAHQRMLEGSAGAATWLSELIWRDFYSMILQHHPQLAGGAAFKPEYDRIEWEQGPEADALFAAWRSGSTGYPLVDAAMLQLNRTGYMHNRLRMVTASFLCKDLGIDWRRGEADFAAHLNDFDFASNNGGWQWAASSGCDAQPYFRIFNPVTQSEKFDPQGKFIRRYLPQLARLPDRYIHAPWTAPAAALEDAGVRLGVTYPRPVIQHDIARKRTLVRYGVVKAAAGKEQRRPDRYHSDDMSA